MHRPLGIKILGIATLLALSVSCGDLKESHPRKGSWVQPHVTRNGRVIKGHYRNSVSFDKDNFKNRMRSRSYYQRNKYRYRKSGK